MSVLEHISETHEDVFVRIDIFLTQSCSMGRGVDSEFLSNYDSIRIMPPHIIVLKAGQH